MDELVPVVEPSLFERVFAQHPNVGPVLQAYLKRTPSDVERAIELGARVRLCKGAYSEPATIAYRDMPTIRREYMRCAEALVSRGTYPGIATHDERLIEAVKAYAVEQGIGKDRFEFQLLYGVRPDVQAALVAEGVQGTAGITFFFPQSIPISASGAFSATETVTMTPYETQSTVGGSGTFTISGHFIKGKIVAHRTNAVVGTFNAPSMCATTTPKRLVMQWDINDL